MKSVEGIFFVATAVLGVLAVFIIYFVLYYRKRQVQNQQEKRELLTAFQQEKLQATLEIQENTFKQVGLELHDNIGQILGFARMQLNHVDTDPRETIRQTDELLGKAINEVRSLSHSLHSGRIEEIGIVNAVRDLLEKIEKSGYAKTTFDYDGHELASHDSSIIVFRMVQEIINNIIKHAEASEVKVEIRRSVGKTSITISDNGKGYDMNVSHDGIGMRNLKDRALLAGAEIEINSRPSEGTTVKILSK